MGIVFVTGGTRGIGQAIAQAFAAEGHTVLVGGRNASENSAFPVLTGDIRDPAVVDGLISRIVQEYGALDVLVNNAGGSPAANTATVSPRFSESIIRLNLMAPLYLAQRANAQMQQQPNGGVILNICSVAGLRGSPTVAAYGAAKAGLLQLTKTFAIEFAPKVRVNAVTPGLIQTAQTGAAQTDAQSDHYAEADAIARTVPLGRFGTPLDVAQACVFLASDKAAYISGANLVLDGGGEWPAFLRKEST